MKTSYELGEEVCVKGKITAIYLNDKAVNYRIYIKLGDGTLRELVLTENAIERRVQQ